MVAIKGRKTTNKNPPIMSHEFVIQNHADIVSCVAMVFVVGLMVQVTSPLAYTFIAIHHNVSSLINIDGTLPPQPTKYTTGWKDACAVFFYFLITIVMHAVLQEYIFDKISKRFRLSKSKFSKFNESTQLITFHAFSLIWATDIIIRENYFLNITSLWNDYPAPMSFSLKFFFVGQIAYWLHSFPELYFQRAKKEEIPRRVFRATIALIYTLGLYLLNFQQVGVILLVLDHAGEALFHGARLIHFTNQKEKATKSAFFLANTVYLLDRGIAIFLSAVYFTYGLAQNKSSFNIAEGNFNIPAIRFSVLGAILLLQFFLLFIHMKYQRKLSGDDEVPAIAPKAKIVKPKSKKKEASKKSGGSESDEPVDSDQGTRKSTRQRTAVKAK